MARLDLSCEASQNKFMSEHKERASAAEMMDVWTGKKVNVKNEQGNLETGWEVAGSQSNPEPAIIVFKKNEFGHLQTRTIPYNQFLEWQK